MSLKVERRGSMTTTDSMIGAKNPYCHTCKERKTGLFTLDVYGNPQCSACALKAGKPIG